MSKFYLKICCNINSNRVMIFNYSACTKCIVCASSRRRCELPFHQGMCVLMHHTVECKRKLFGTICDSSCGFMNIYSDETLSHFSALGNQAQLLPFAVDDERHAYINDVASALFSEQAENLLLRFHSIYHDEQRRT